MIVDRNGKHADFPPTGGHSTEFELFSKNVQLPGQLAAEVRREVECQFDDRSWQSVYATQTEGLAPDKLPVNWHGDFGRAFPNLKTDKPGVVGMALYSFFEEHAEAWTCEETSTNAGNPTKCYRRYRPGSSA
jgi:hypothetical protein